MKSYEWDAAKHAFVEVDDPTYDETLNSMEESLAKAGYVAQFSSELESSVGGSIALYTTADANKPRFYIDIMGQTEGIATLVARDFPSLVATLREIHPLLTLAGLDQLSSARVADELRSDTR